ncbi:Hypothetical predicted protein [Podarcis lilfordi]|uniref:Uncharacterized protein n=1 Tax=Podarcis lilfordi TaxID=74358 RepID=A0AA35KGD6_9SAUR|nr:Hypothetical predicted protein [Podarcis lilfordi]
MGNKSSDTKQMGNGSSATSKGKVILLPGMIIQESFLQVDYIQCETLLS